MFSKLEMFGAIKIYTRKEPFIKQQNIRAATRNQTFVTTSNSKKKTRFDNRVFFLPQRRRHPWRI